jgi:purine-binding chemotaxis protein CheW
MTLDDQKYLSFHMAREEFAIPLLEVREVIAPPKTTPIPGAQKHFIGMMDLRGEVVSIIDLKARLGLGAGEVKEDQAVIILDLNGTTIGVLVDGIDRVFNMEKENFSASSPAGTGLKTDYIEGVYREANKLTLIVSIAKMLGKEDINKAQQMNQKAA